MRPRVSLGQSSQVGLSQPGQSVPTDESILVERVRSGDERAFQVLFHQYYAPLHAFVLSLVRERETADECVQDVLHHVWTLGPRWQIRGSLRGYLYAAARNQALNHLKHRRVIARWATVAAAEVEVSGMSQGVESPDAACRRHELGEAVRKAMARLPERRRTVLALRLQHGLKNLLTAAMFTTAAVDVYHLGGDLPPTLLTAHQAGV